MTDLIVRSVLHDLENGPLYRFMDWPEDKQTLFQKDNKVPGVLTIWNLEQNFIYAGCAKKDLKRRLDTHYRGELGDNQFAAYVLNRYILDITAHRLIERVVRGEFRIDELIHEYIVSHFSYRFVTLDDGDTALKIKEQLMRGEWPPGKPFLNPWGMWARKRRRTGVI